MKEDTKEIILSIIIGIVILFVVVAFTMLMVDADEAKEKCAKEFGGTLVCGYCTYVENGTSQSYLAREKEK